MAKLCHFNFRNKINAIFGNRKKELIRYLIFGKLCVILCFSVDTLKSQIMQNVKNPLIFIVEDSVVYRELIVGHLQSKNFTNIKTFDNGEDCLNAIHLKPDLIVLDYSFGGINGLELMKKVKAENPWVDFVFISGQNDVEVAVNIMKLGAADYVVKNNQAPYRLVRALEQLQKVTRKEKMKQGFKFGVVSFFILLFIVIVSIIFITIFFDL